MYLHTIKGDHGSLQKIGRMAREGRQVTDGDVVDNMGYCHGVPSSGSLTRVCETTRI